ncbi:TraE/TraK family type IV conjugative transfer system protein [Curvibacter sp. APW13]|uniref:TraE/TraK family type IV conjugative transfer system protein n=1 Tax=Curvibacter sp. APW13 TaxID=3077236 RepID=UPI0028E06DAB|nr:TraE/TraK family type IV conjugative transfer system protein [Curvibacter sp. APW13]MDT8992868.1 TraE/TraK family type IV conjugative transfer system protein [Curvibacter sp. APW13]
MNLDELSKAVRRMMTVVVVFAGLATVLSISSLLALFRSQAALERAVNERAVMVVPGAVAGEYIAGLSEENLKGVARYIGQLGTSFTPANFKLRMDELMAYADSAYLPTLANEAKKLEMEVVAQAQGRFFLPDTQSERLVVVGNNEFEYTTTGSWAFSAGGLALSQDDIGRVTVRFRLGQSDQRNKYGVKILRFSAVRAKGAQQ